ncbi:hypothetical protein [Salmonella enterica]|uniref:hypothetical protein n=1 Tax=Salmonella enterica TaxID=28901 RepID=UPI004037D126
MALYVSSCRRSLATLISGGRGAAEHTDRLLHAAITSLIQAVRIPPRERCLKAFLRLINYSAGDLYSLIHLNSSSVTFSSRDFPASVLPDSIISHSALFIFLSEKRTQFVGELPGFLTMAVNRINIFQRWRKRETAEHCEKFSALIPAILEAIRKSAPELHKRITAGQSIEYLLSQLLKKPQWPARYFLARRWRILSGSVTRPYMRYRRYVAVIASSTRDMTSE